MRRWQARQWKTETRTGSPGQATRSWPQTRLAVLNSQPGAEAVEDAPMPRWGWGEVRGPYQPKGY